MDFENPFAEEEEPEVIPNEPLLDYDSGKKEEDFNALVVLSSKLEQSCASQEKTESEFIATATQKQDKLSQTVAQQRQLIQLRQKAIARTTDHARTTRGAEHTRLGATMQAVLDDLSSRLREHDERAHKLEHSANLYASKLAAVAQQHASARQAEAEQAEAADRPALLASSVAAHVEIDALSQMASGLSRADAQQVQALLDDVARHYTQCEPQQVAHSAAGAEEVALALATARNVDDTLDMVNAMDEQLREQVRQLTKGMETLQAFDHTRLRLARLLDQQQARGAAGGPSTDPAALVDLTRLSSANDSLRNETRRLERALLALTTRPDEDQPADTKQTATGVSRAMEMALHIAAMDQAGSQLEKESIVLGKEVLRLRRRLATLDNAFSSSPTSAKAESPSPSCTVATAPPTMAAVTELDSSKTNAMIDALTQLSQVLATLDAPSSDGLVTAASHAPRSATALTTALTAGFDAMAQIQRTCLGPLQTINDELRKQAFTSHLLRRLALRGTDFCNPVVDRVLEGCSTWLAGRSQEVEDEAQRSRDDAATYSRALEATLEELIRDASADAATFAGSQEARGKRERLYQALIDCAVEDPQLCAALMAQNPEVSGLTPVQQPSPPLCLTFDTHAFSDALAAEGSFAETQYRDFVAESSSVLRDRVEELRKKLTWFEKQPYTALLRELYNLNRQNEALSEQLAQDEQTLMAGEDPETKIATLREAIGQAQAKASQFTARLTELRHAEQALLAEEAAAMAYLRD